MQKLKVKLFKTLKLTFTIATLHKRQKISTLSNRTVRLK